MSVLKHINPESVDRAGRGPVEMVIASRASDINGFGVLRALPARRRQMVGPFIFWDQIGPGGFLSGQGLDIAPHPHIGLSTVTYLFSGSLDHKDSLGSAQRIHPGDLNVMTAGRGIVHSERTSAEARQEPSDLYGIQAWLALPKEHEGCAPRFEHTGRAELPELEYEGMKARVIMGDLWGEMSPVNTFTDTLYLDVTLEAGAIFEVPEEVEERAVYVLEGQVGIGGSVHDSRQLLVLRSGDQTVVKALSNARVMVLGGAAMDGPRYIWWNFVSSSKARIEQAKEDWRAGRFDKIADDEEYIPLPES